MIHTRKIVEGLWYIEQVRFLLSHNAIQVGLQEKDGNMFGLGWLVVIVCGIFSLMAVAGLALACAGNREDQMMMRDTTIPKGLPVKNVQPDMNTAKQKRKAVAEIEGYILAGELEKAYYAMHLLNQMLDSIESGQPRPWSEFQPMLVEEFA